MAGAETASRPTPQSADDVDSPEIAGDRHANRDGLRPPRGMQMFVEPLGLTTPLAAFNGGRFVRPDLSLVEQRVLAQDAVEPVLAIIKWHQLDSWIYRGNDWFVRERHGPHVDREEWTVKFPPTVVPDFADNSSCSTSSASDKIPNIRRPLFNVCAAR